MRLTIPASHPSLLGDKKGVLFIGRNKNLPQRLDALKAIADAREPRAPLPALQDIDASAPNYAPGISRKAVE